LNRNIAKCDRVRRDKGRCVEMNYDVVRSDSARNLSTTSTELEFSLVLARVIGSIESDPSQLRNAVYELARVKLQQETWQRHPPMSGDGEPALEAGAGGCDRPR
jgi:hypothetical protein